MNYTTYLFDFDYTLADSSRGIVTCFRNVLNRHGYTHPTDDDIKRTIGKTLEDSFSILSGVTDPQQLAEFKKEYVKEADTHMTVNTVLFLETKSVLMALYVQTEMNNREVLQPEAVCLYLHHTVWSAPRDFLTIRCIIINL